MVLPTLVELVGRGAVFVLAGAGLSTASGIPDYRGPETARRARRPVQHREFLASEDARRRYWARACVGWPSLAAARPNPGHRALAELERHGALAGLVTQNVDGLHQQAGSRDLVELHGALREVVCLGCGGLSDREAVQRRMTTENPGFGAVAVALADGDAELEEVAGFRVPACDTCGGILKPNVVFFGDNVPAERVERAFGALARARSVLVVGSSLEVFSGRRFVRRAAASSLPIAIVGLGPTRGDDLATVRLEARLEELLPALVDAVGARRI